MVLRISRIKKAREDISAVYLIRKGTSLKGYPFTIRERNYIMEKIERDIRTVAVNSYPVWRFVQVVEEDKPVYRVNESMRKAGNSILTDIRDNKISEIVLVDDCNCPHATLSFAEGMALGNYQFLKYLKEKEEKRSPLRKIRLFSSGVKDVRVRELGILTEAACLARDLVNEPASYLTAVRLAKEIQDLGTKAGFMTEVFNKKKIESLKMGGLLAVNRGSVDPPTFSILEWKPPKRKNKKPLILVGKGIVFDTGGLSLKPTKDSMDYMKSDMSGAAAVAGVFYAVARARLPIHLIGLIPATDNRPDGNAYAPGDVVKMYNGLNVEVLNTDAEGRMILADALSYAKKYNPGLVINIATLTGSAAVAIGKYGIVGMGNAGREYFDRLIQSGENVFERIVEFPFWEEYDELLKSDIADIKNIGGRDGGAITAGRFLERFTDYPFIHLDIAGPAFVAKEDSYRSKGGTAVGVRLIFDFIRNYTG